MTYMASDTHIRLCGKQKRAVDVNGVKLAATYQPMWSGHTQEFTKYMDELEDMLISNNLLVIGGDFNCSFEQS